MTENKENYEVKAVATRPKSIKEYLRSEAMLAEISKALPNHMSAERMARVALTAMTRTPLLNDCTPESFMKCLLDLSQWGLEPDGRRAHLIPFRNRQKGTVECTLIIDYKGLVELAYRSGSVRIIHADVVREGDIFIYSLGEVRDHIPWAFRVDTDKPAKAGEIIAAYCVVRMEHDCIKCEVMTREEVDGIRARSKSANDGPWATDYAEMAKKTAFRRASKWLPLAAEVHEAFDRDDHQYQVVQPVRPAITRTESLMGKLQESGFELQEVVDD
jgi:recombination protein RecT